MAVPPFLLSSHFHLRRCAVIVLENFAINPAHVMSATLTPIQSESDKGLPHLEFHVTLSNGRVLKLRRPSDSQTARLYREFLSQTGTGIDEAYHIVNDFLVEFNHSVYGESGGSATPDSLAH